MNPITAKPVQLLAGAVIAAAAVGGAAAPSLAAGAAPAAAATDAPHRSYLSSISEGEWIAIDKDIQAAKGSGDRVTVLNHALEAAYKSAQPKVANPGQVAVVAYRADLPLDTHGVEAAANFTTDIDGTKYAIAVFTDPVTVTNPTNDLGFDNWQAKASTGLSADGPHTVKVARA